MMFKFIFKMGRTIIAEESIRDGIDNMFGNVQWQIGLIVGQVTFFDKLVTWKNFQNNATKTCLAYGLLEDL